MNISTHLGPQPVIYSPRVFPVTHLLAVIHRAEKMSAGMRPYWTYIARTDSADVIDPWRTPLRSLRQVYPRGTLVYRASTGGRWGKSAQRVRL